MAQEYGPETDKKRISGWYTALAFAYGRNGTVEAWVKVGGKKHRDRRTGSGTIRAEVLKIGHTGWEWTWYGPRRRRETLETYAYANVESCPGEAGPWYRQEANDGAHQVIVAGIMDILALMRRLD